MTPVVLAALNLAQALTIYTHGDEARAAELERTVQAKAPLGKLSPAQRKRVTVERRRIQSVRMASSEGSAVLVTLADGTETKEAFIVSFVYFVSCFLLNSSCRNINQTRLTQTEMINNTLGLSTSAGAQRPFRRPARCREGARRRNRHHPPFLRDEHPGRLCGG